MAQTPEAKVKAKVVAILKYYGAYYFYPMTHGYGASGVPDIICCYKGYFIGIECKAGKNKATPLQKKNLKEISKSGGYAMIVNEETIVAVEALLDLIKHQEEKTVELQKRNQ